MSELLQQFHFLRPWWLAALLLLPPLGWLGVRRNVAQVELSRLVDAELLPHLLRGRAGNRSLPLWLFALGWTLCALALAGPTWSRVEQPLYASRAAQVVAISLSQRMLARDVAPSRLDRTRYKARDLLHANQDGLNALVGYAGEAFVVAPLTSDAHSLDDLLEAMAPDTMPVDGDNAAAAIERGVALIQGGKVSGGSLVLITDQADAAAAAAARKANATGVRVSVLGVGTPQGGPVPLPDGGFVRDAQGGMLLARRDDAALAALAAAGGGRYVAMSADQRDVDALHAQLRSAKATLADGQVGDAWQDRGAWLLLPLLLVVALAFRRGWLLLLPLVVLPLWPGAAEATTWHDLWQRRDQQAAQALHAGDAKQAQQLARDPAWRGAAAYRAGDYAAAAQALQQAPGGDAAYNLGNTLAKQGAYQKALAAYDHALQLDPANADAKANRQAVEDWLRQQQQPSDQKEHEGHGGKQNQSSQGEQGKSGKQDAKDQSSAANDAEPSDQPGRDGKSQAQDQSGKNASQQGKSEQGGADQPKPQTTQQQAEQQAQAEQAQQALKQQMDAALAKPGESKAEHQLGALAKDDPQAKLPADLRHALQRVPDDPGALLRRKFELEYQQRHGGAPSEDGQP
ncbi:MULTISPECIES: tetratricopeptide repeat protein [Rhodanobacter]|uniref:tetratricopeptide repeat protein n=1 Tax=Rhodanobacter TaxID=75309 RepID=UPI0004289EF6|nr:MULTISPECIES: tetratricopeptide repeat protein [Rhodanobacter]KZC19209.1 colicin transporter [Rhodanobacter denitrificans]UJJ50493.1 VWA domain-containing protein [Rhodanobacter denitrificans]UJM93209.1 VWA domain-containing protein [Rhodanobacter denitrificans]UJM96741.1 VWA domain-containing protein [Rhodanobacter denitrificans]UJN20430.1 VWA domain-containing protein [Rhodanobacter denitrificans]